MDITPSQAHRLRSRSRSRTRNSTANSRSTSATRRPLLSGSIRSLSSSSLNKLQFSSTAVELSKDRSIPSVSATLDNSLPLDFFKQELIGLIKALRISKWHKRQLCVANMLVSRILGALTNSIYKLEYNDPDLPVPCPSLLLRVYGKNVDELIDRDSELKILIKLSAKKIGPKMLGIFANGRFEQFLEGFITMGKEEIRDAVISQMIGRRMKDLHYKIELDDSDKELEFPVAWIQILKWLNLFETELLPTYADQKAVEDVLLLPWNQFRELVFTYKNWLFSKYDGRNFASNYHFCHNDTQYGNLLLKSTFDSKDVIQESNSVLPNTSNRRDKDLAVIDFEYSGANFPAFDIADHFSEWMADYHDPEKSYYIHEDKYPTKLEQLNLIKSYIEYDFQFPSSNLQTSSAPSVAETDATALIEYEVKKMYNEIIYWRATVQIFWLIWGLIQHGPITKKDPVDLLSSRTEEQGITSTYNITEGLDAVNLDGNPILEEEGISSSDDDFDYLKYTQQKSALVIGDMISFGFLSISDVAPEYHNIIKFLDSQAYEL
ncbi:CIC11C00000002051 [Sungouiella intermedia]|uniref:CIC11C00000002051 n=1 Tax=Sungouiella intermedia TaxID=45354 RepID=A0A1L0BBE3_9ASCO|nr:CIC11C00000002051 [[Candida] intermedia]